MRFNWPAALALLSATAALIQGSYCILPLASSFPYRRSSMVGFPARRPATHVAESKHLTNVMMELSSPKSAAGRYASRRPVSASFDALRKLDLHVSVGVCCTSSATQTKHAAMTLERGQTAVGGQRRKGAHTRQQVRCRLAIRRCVSRAYHV